jgi:hypothetical protein
MVDALGRYIPNQSLAAGRKENRPSQIGDGPSSAIGPSLHKGMALILVCHKRKIAGIYSNLGMDEPRLST